MVSDRHQINGRSSHTANSMEMAPNGQDGVAIRHKSTKKVCVIVLVIGALVIAALILVAIIIGVRQGSPEAKSVRNGSPTISLEDIIEGTLTPRSFNATYISGTELFYRDTAGNVFIYDIPSRRKRKLMSAENEELAAAFDYELSSDKKYLLVALNYRKLYRHSYLAEYLIVELKTGHIERLKHNTDSQMQLVSWAPKNNGFVFVLRNDIYYVKSAASPNSAIRLTADGLFGVNYNGVPDWVYEEEVFSSNSALWWSPNGTRLAYASFDDNETRIMSVPFYGKPGELEFQYPLTQAIRYPKVGTPNPTVKFSVVNLDDAVATSEVLTKTLPLPHDLRKKEPILSAVAWATDKVVSTIWMNRDQNEAKIISYDTENTTNIIEMSSMKQSHGWLELFTAPMYSRAGDRMLLVMSHDQGNGFGAYRHVTMYEQRANSVGVPLTAGRHVVTDIVAWDEDEGYIYYLANTPTDYAVRHLYRVSDKIPTTRDGVASSSNATAYPVNEPECVTCRLNSSFNDAPCLYNGAEFSSKQREDGTTDNYEYFTVKCLGPSVPESTIISKKNLTRTFVWENNEEIAEFVQKKMMPVTQRFVVDIADRFQAQVTIQMPPDVDTSGSTKYPMLINVYGGPDSFQVTDRWTMDWGSYLAANRSILVASIDGRGSGLKGDRMLFSGYRNLGTVEIDDQINVTKYMQQQLPYVDATKTAIWGWSYGGYATGMSLAKDTERVFKCGISVAPVTDWALYDSIYTERFMNQPTVDDNLEGYVRAQLVNKVEGLRNKRYFLVHGTMDDNVHYQQSMMLARALEQHDILFRQLSYPDEDHGLLGVRQHLYHSLGKFLDDCFELNEHNDRTW